MVKQTNNPHTDTATTSLNTPMLNTGHRQPRVIIRLLMASKTVRSLTLYMLYKAEVVRSSNSHPIVEHLRARAFHPLSVTSRVKFAFRTGMRFCWAVRFRNLSLSLCLSFSSLYKRIFVGGGIKETEKVKFGFLLILLRFYFIWNFSGVVAWSNVGWSDMLFLDFLVNFEISAAIVIFH